MNSPSGITSSPGTSAWMVVMRRAPAGTLTWIGTQPVSCTVTGNPAIIGDAISVTGLSTAPTVKEPDTWPPAHAAGGATFAVVDAPGARSVGVSVRVNGEPAASAENPIASGTLPVFFTTTFLGSA